MFEFRPADLIQWSKDKAYSKGVYEKILYQDPATSSYVRLLRLDPGTGGSAPITHDFDEVVYVLSGGLVNTATGEAYPEGSFAFFPRGTKHGPFAAPVGCTTIEFRQYKRT
jgi:quercetin dioxygenase-like cupin family protein